METISVSTVLHDYQCGVVLLIIFVKPSRAGGIEEQETKEKSLQFRKWTREGNRITYPTP